VYCYSRIYQVTTSIFSLPKPIKTLGMDYIGNQVHVGSTTNLKYQNPKTLQGTHQ
jgi:hypothetical protein